MKHKEERNKQTTCCHLCRKCSGYQHGAYSSLSDRASWGHRRCKHQWPWTRVWWRQRHESTYPSRICHLGRSARANRTLQCWTSCFQCTSQCPFPSSKSNPLSRTCETRTPFSSPIQNCCQTSQFSFAWKSPCWRMNHSAGKCPCFVFLLLLLFFTSNKY